MADKRTGRAQKIKFSSDHFPLDIHKSMFINDLEISVPASYVRLCWGDEVLNKHNKKDKREKRVWEVVIKYISPRELGAETFTFNAKLDLSASARSKESSYGLKWNKDFAVQLAKDYPKSFVRALEFHIGDEHYKGLKYTEFDIGGFKEQLQVKIEWDNNMPLVTIKEYFRIRNESQVFPMVFKQLSSYLIAEYLLSSEDELLRRILVTEWKSRPEMEKELNENNIYILLNRERGEIYFGETKKSLSQRYPKNQKHHSFDNWDEYSIIQLPPETSDHTRLLIERVLITFGAKFFPNILYDGEPVLGKDSGYKLMNRKK